jgi:glucokinase
MSSRLAHTLLGDIGATNARFTLLANGVLGPIESFEVARHARFADVVTEFLDRHRGPAPVEDALIAVAGPVEQGRCALTNCSWVIDAQELRTTFRLAKVCVINDFEATAFSLPKLTAADLRPIGGGRAVPAAPKAVLGPGTGLGVACLVTGALTPVVIASEGGHMTMAATSRREDALIDHLRQHFGHVSAERLISGIGLENIYQAVAALDGRQIPSRGAAEITKAALDGSCQTARAALDAFCSFLGSFAGNVALMFGARGGIYVAGGIVPRIVEFTASSRFRERFEAKGRLQPYLEAIPTSLIVHPAAAFLGLRSLAQGHPDAES